MRLDPWQRTVLDGAFGEDEHGLWVARDVGLVVSRQSGKGAVLEAMVLAGLFLFGERDILWTAHELKTAREGFRRVLGLIDGSADLSRLVKRIRNVNGQESIELLSGQRLQFLARSKRSGRGYTADRLLLDEAMDLPHEALESLLPTMSSRPNPQTVYTGSAGWATSDVFRRVRERGLMGDDRLAFFEWSADPTDDLDDPAAWAKANPALGYRMTADVILNERANLSDEGFARERLGIWDEPAGSRTIPQPVWDGAALSEGDVERINPIAVAFDVDPEQQWGSVAVGGRRSDGSWQVEVWAAQPGDDWIVAEVARIAQERTVLRVVCDPRSPAGALVPQMRAAGVEVEAISLQELGQACSGFYSDLVSDRLFHTAQPVLDGAVAVARKRNVGEAGWAWRRRNVSDDITPLVAVTLARHAALTAPASTPDPVSQIW